MALITGWGRGTWNEGAWNSPLSVALTGVSAATAVGTVLIWNEIVPGQDAEWNPITYTQSPNWTKMAA